MERRPFQIGDRVRINAALGSGMMPTDIPDMCVGRVTDPEFDRFVTVRFRGGKTWTWSAAMFEHVTEPPAFRTTFNEWGINRLASGRCIIVTRSDRDDATRVHLDVVRTDRQFPDGFHTELLLDGPTALGLAAAIHDAYVASERKANA